MTQKQTHTPGPWRVLGGAGMHMWDIVGPKGEDLAYVNPTDGLDEPETYPVEANARLIATAPDLLAALKGLLADIQEYQRINHLGGEDNHWQVAARAAIAKAEGEV